MELTRFLIYFGLLLLPGFMLWRELGDRGDALEDGIEGVSLGFALLAVVGYWVAFVSVSWIPIAVVAFFGIAVLAHVYLPRAEPEEAPRGLAHPGLLLGIVLLVVAISRYAPSVQTDLPLGWDPTFHLLLAGKIQQTNRVIDDWRPYADLTLNYPIGPHILLAALSDVSHLPLHAVFRLLLATVGVLTTAQIYLFATRISQSPTVGLASAVAYGFWAWWGSIDYLRWGGLPNESGMFFLMAAMSSLMAKKQGKARTLLTSTFFAAVLVAHHHVMVVAGLVGAGVLVQTFFWPEDRPLVRRFVVGGVGGMLLAAAFAIPYAMKAMSLGATGIFEFKEPIPGLLGTARYLGVAFFAFSLAGVALVLRRAPPWPHLRLAVASIASILSVYAVLGFVWPFVSVRMGGEPVTPFTPTRFLTDSVYFLSVFAGFGFHALARRLALAPPLAVALGVAIGVTNYWDPKRVYEKLGLIAVGQDRPDEPAAGWKAVFERLARIPPPAYLAACAWIRDYTPPESLVLDRVYQQGWWAAYLTRRRTPYVFIPVSEPDRPERRAELNRFFERAGRGDPSVGPVYAIASAPDKAHGPIRWKGPGNIVVYQVPPASDGTG